MEGKALRTSIADQGIEFAAPSEKDLDDREWLTTLAYRKMRFHNMSVDDDLEAVSPLRGLALDEAFSDLREALDRRDGLADGSLSWVDTHPDLCGYDRDGQALDAASTRVEDALDALLGGAR